MKKRTPKGPRRTARQAILDTAVVMLAESPDAPMAAIAEAAGVGRATLYRQFPSREDLIRELTLQSIRLTDEAVAPVFADYVDAESALLGMLEALLPFGDQYHFLSREAHNTMDDEVAAETRRQLDELGQFVDQAKSEGLFASDVPTSWIVSTIDSLIWTAWHAIHKGQLTAKDAAKLAHRTLTQGLRGGSDR